VLPLPPGWWPLSVSLMPIEPSLAFGLVLGANKTRKGAARCAAQDPVMYTDGKTGITFGTWSVQGSTDPNSVAQGSYSFGMVLPPDATTKDATEYIGYLKCSSTSATETGWCGLSHGLSGQMTQSLLLMAWPFNGQVLTSFRYATGYQPPGLYAGNAILTQISSSVSATGYELIYRCQNCFSWDHDGAKGNVSTAAGLLVLGRAQAKRAPTNPSCPNTITPNYHNNGFGQWGAPLAGVVNANYAKWAALATTTVTGACGAAPVVPSSPASSVSVPSLPVPTSLSTSVISTATATSVPVVPTVSTPAASPSTSSAAPASSMPASCSKVGRGQIFDYVIAGGGAGGIPMADRLARAGYSVLLAEKGPPSTARWGGKMKPAWLEGEPLTRFDVPGLCNQIWVDSAGVACTDTDQMAGCVLGGGTAVNAGLWWKVSRLLLPKRICWLTPAVLIAEPSGLGLQLPSRMAF
jgi:cellobiose dehydrogenase (acceptor)